MNRFRLEYKDKQGRTCLYGTLSILATDEQREQAVELCKKFLAGTFRYDYSVNEQKLNEILSTVQLVTPSIGTYSDDHISPLDRRVGVALPDTETAATAVRRAQAAWEQHERRTDVQLSIPADES